MIAVPLGWLDHAHNQDLWVPLKQLCTPGWWCGGNSLKLMIRQGNNTWDKQTPVACTRYDFWHSQRGSHVTWALLQALTWRYHYWTHCWVLPTQSIARFRQELKPNDILKFKFNPYLFCDINLIKYVHECASQVLSVVATRDTVKSNQVCMQIELILRPLRCCS